MKILLTGPTGFIGAAFLRLALIQGQQVGGLLCPGESPPPGDYPQDAAVWFTGTLAQAPWQQIMSFHPEVCLHTAWITTPDIYLESPDNDRFAEWSGAFLAKFYELGGLYAVALGTCIEYQTGPYLLREEQTPIMPNTRYARCKDTLRLALETEAKRLGRRACWGRVFYPYGVGEHPGRLCSSLIRQMACHKPIALKNPRSTKDYIYIDDLAAAILAVIENQYAGPINLGTGAGVTVLQIAQTIGQIMGCTHLLNLDQAASSPAEDPFGFVVADATRLRSLGWKPAISLTEGLTRLVKRLTPTPSLPQ